VEGRVQPAGPASQPSTLPCKWGRVVRLLVYSGRAGGVNHCIPAAAPVVRPLAYSGHTAVVRAPLTSSWGVVTPPACSARAASQ
jgi:hypothetical protein